MVSCLPVTWHWEWKSVPALRLLVSDQPVNGDESPAMLPVWVVEGWYVAEVESGAEPVRLAKIDPPEGLERAGEAVEGLGRVFAAVALGGGA